ncbi:MAG: HEAT repeat domain-containing protein [Candidatus ainarchaeum sp.]|nr:HEAT repeat domain-containing protein [Candidatus ainarchaeum sp.]
MDSATANINKLVSLTFDENPEVRKQAAKSLGALGDPAAVFALVELTYDKDPSVREVAQKYLEKKKQTEPELMSFATIFSSGAKKEEKGEEPEDAREKVLRPITQIFERRLGKEKAEVARNKMMPTIEKIYQKAHEHGGSKKKHEEAGRKVMQEFLTSYLEVMSDLDSIGDGTHHLPEAPAVQPPQEQQEIHEPEIHEEQPIQLIVQEQPVHRPQIPEQPPNALSDQLEEVGKQSGELDKVSTEIASLETQEMEELKERQEIEHLPDTFFKKAYETMMLSGGDEDVMHQEMEKMAAEAKREIGLAFRLAKSRFKEMKVTNITKIKDGMRNINTDLLIVKGVEPIEYQKTKKVKAMATRVVLNDDSGNEGVLYLFEDRGTGLRPAMRIKIVKGMVKVFRGETALTISKNGNVYIVL